MTELPMMVRAGGENGADCSIPPVICLYDCTHTLLRPPDFLTQPSETSLADGWLQLEPHCHAANNRVGPQAEYPLQLIHCVTKFQVRGSNISLLYKFQRLTGKNTCGNYTLPTLGGHEGGLGSSPQIKYP